MCLKYLCLLLLFTFLFFIFSGLHRCFPFFDGVCEVFEEVDGQGRLLNDEEGPGRASLDVDNFDWLVSGVDVILGLLLLIGVLPFDLHTTNIVRLTYLFLNARDHAEYTRKSRLTEDESKRHENNKGSCRKK